jgi:hypothetical protein
METKQDTIVKHLKQATAQAYWLGTALGLGVKIGLGWG